MLPAGSSSRCPGGGRAPFGHGTISTPIGATSCSTRSTITALRSPRHLLHLLCRPLQRTVNFGIRSRISARLPTGNFCNSVHCSLPIFLYNHEEGPDF